MERIEATKLEIGKVYADLSDNVVEPFFGEYKGNLSFKYVGGAKCYSESSNGLVEFEHITDWYIPLEGEPGFETHQM